MGLTTAANQALLLLLVFSGVGVGSGIEVTGPAVFTSVSVGCADVDTGVEDAEEDENSVEVVSAKVWVRN
jgi:hypothetical protein